MLLGLSLFWVGAVLFLNGLWVLETVGESAIAVFDVFVGALTLVVSHLYALGRDTNIGCFSLSRSSARRRRCEH